MPTRKKTYDYKHVLANSDFSHATNTVTLSPDLNIWGKEGYRIITILPTAKEGWFDIFLERENIE